MENYDVAIIGSGPAGLTAAIYTSRANLKTLVIAGEKWGGQLMLTNTVENFPGFPDGIQGPELMEKMKTQTEKFGAKIVLENATKIEKHDSLFLVSCILDIYHARSVIVATGADIQWLGLPNEQRLIGHGVSSCAPCDAFFFKGKKVAVVGGGDAAMEEALVLTKFASEVTIVHRRDAFRASKIMQDRVLSNPKIKVVWNSEVVDILGQEKVEGIVIKTTNSVPPTAGQVTSPKAANSYQLPVDGLFVAIGHSPNSKIFEGMVELDEKGFVKRVPREGFETTTSTDGIFVAGDVHDYHYKQAITAAAYGCMAALEVEKWLETHG